MNNEECEIYLKEIREWSKELLKSKKKCREFLVSTGVYNEDGTLTGPYKNKEENMLIYNKEEKKEEKSWSIQLQNHAGEPKIIAVDTHTGEFICILITFAFNGSVISVKEASDTLTFEGYDTLQHNNKWEYEGNIIIEPN